MSTKEFGAKDESAQPPNATAIRGQKGATLLSCLFQTQCLPSVPTPTHRSSDHSGQGRGQAARCDAGGSLKVVKRAAYPAAGTYLTMKRSTVELLATVTEAVTTSPGLTGLEGSQTATLASSRNSLS